MFSSFTGRSEGKRFRSRFSNFTLGRLDFWFRCCQLGAYPAYSTCIFKQIWDNLQKFRWILKNLSKVLKMILKGIYDIIFTREICINIYICCVWKILHFFLLSDSGFSLYQFKEIFLCIIHSRKYVTRPFRNIKS